MIMHPAVGKQSFVQNALTHVSDEVRPGRSNRSAVELAHRTSEERPQTRYIFLTHHQPVSAHQVYQNFANSPEVQFHWYTIPT